MKQIISVLLCAMLLVQPVLAEEENSAIQITAPSALLMESSTGQVIYEKDADTKRAPASVTKIMTLLLVFDALEDGKIKLEDIYTYQNDSVNNIFQTKQEDGSLKPDTLGNQFNFPNAGTYHANIIKDETETIIGYDYIPKQDKYEDIKYTNTAVIAEPISANHIY